jgi:EpsI family protein
VRIDRTLRIAIGFVLAALLAAFAAHRLQPTREAPSFPNAKLEAVIPEAFGDWRLDRSIVPIQPDPGALAAIEAIYSDTLARTYVNSRGQRIMLSLAYGRRQNDNMRLHQPEGCYSGQGFAVSKGHTAVLDLGERRLPVRRLVATLAPRIEPITYWMVVGGVPALSAMQAKLAQLRFGVRGYIADGLLFRVSSISANEGAAYELQDAFVRDLVAAVDRRFLPGILGT